MNRISLLPPSGFRDFSPEETSVRQNLIDTISKIYKQFGFAPICVTSFENLEVLQGKGGGSDNEKLIFKILRRGEDLKNALSTGEANNLSDMGLRFDLTLPLARYYAARRNELPRPFKVFHIAPVWRADRPQKGRYREFYQCDVDILGTKEIGAEVECLSAILSVFNAVKLNNLTLSLNDRRLLVALGKSLGAPPEQWALVLVILDKLDKVGPEKVEAEILEKGLLNPSQVESLRKYVFSKEDTTNLWSELDAQAIAELNALIALLKNNSQNVRVQFTPSLVRGQDYYTGTIFEVSHPDFSGSIAGGGRYDKLLELFQGEPVSAFGGSIGFERLCLLMNSQEFKDIPQVFIPLFSADMRPKTLELAIKLRAAGYSVDAFPDATKLKNQFKYADDRKIPFTILVGEDEAKRGIVKLKNMQARTEIEVNELELVKTLESLCKPIAK